MVAGSRLGVRAVAVPDPDRIDDPVMDRVQLPANNTGMGQGGRAPIPGDPSAPAPKLPPPPSGVQVVS